MISSWQEELMQIDYGNHDKKSKIKLNKRLLGCPTCRKSRYVVITSIDKDKRYHYLELYCHSCDNSFLPIDAVTPFELNELSNNMKM
jgi:transcription elongation factor Elf1